jgi:SAM-dependent methyltransferase
MVASIQSQPAPGQRLIPDAAGITYGHFCQYLLEHAYRLEGVRMSRTERLRNVIANESLLWGKSVAETYHSAAARDMERHWNSLIWPMLSRHAIDFSVTLELACGYGRNSRKLLQAGATSLTLVDVNPDNIAYCRDNIQPLGNVDLVQNNGIDLEPLTKDTFTFVYTFDSMVHFDLELIISYIAEISRVLKVGGLAFIHHSNYSEAPGADFKNNPHWRNFMSAKIMRHIAIKNRLDVVEQQIIDWGGSHQIDCMSLLKRTAD